MCKVSKHRLWLWRHQRLMDLGSNLVDMGAWYKEQCSHREHYTSILLGIKLELQWSLRSHRYILANMAHNL